jgi:hypothetical protein
MHEDLSMPAMAATTSASKAIMLFTLTGNGGPTGADHGGFYPSTAFGRLGSTSGGLLNSTVNIAALGQSPQDGFTEYQGYPGTIRPRWGDYSWGFFVPDNRADLVRQRVHPVPELHPGAGVHAGQRDLRWHEERLLELGYLGQLRGPLTIGQQRVRARICGRGPSAGQTALRRA